MVGHRIFPHRRRNSIHYQNARSTTVPRVRAKGGLALRAPHRGRGILKGEEGQRSTRRGSGRAGIYQLLSWSTESLSRMGFANRSAGGPRDQVEGESMGPVNDRGRKNAARPKGHSLRVKWTTRPYFVISKRASFLHVALPWRDDDSRVLSVLTTTHPRAPAREMRALVVRKWSGRLGRHFAIFPGVLAKTPELSTLQGRREIMQIHFALRSEGNRSSSAR